MASAEHIQMIQKGIDAWNEWRLRHTQECVDLSGVDFRGFCGRNAALFRANLRNANFENARLPRADFYGSNMNGTTFTGAYLPRAKFEKASLCGADLTRANLRKADFLNANLEEGILRDADLQQVQFVDTKLNGVDLSGCRIYGLSAWGLELNAATQKDLIVTRDDEPEVTVDNLEVAQFIYMLLHNAKIRDVIDTIGKKAVLILGRFTPERKAVLDALREELRKRDYVPILFDFEKPASQDLTTTVSTLAHLARFIIADLTDPSSIPYELASVVPTTPVPIQPIILSGSVEFAMFVDLRRRYGWVLPTQAYDDLRQLTAEFGERVIRPAEDKVAHLRASAVALTS